MLFFWKEQVTITKLFTTLTNTEQESKTMTTIHYCQCNGRHLATMLFCIAFLDLLLGGPFLCCPPSILLRPNERTEPWQGKNRTTKREKWKVSTCHELIRRENPFHTRTLPSPSCKDLEIVSPWPAEVQSTSFVPKVSYFFETARLLFIFRKEKKVGKLLICNFLRVFRPCLGRGKIQRRLWETFSPFSTCTMWITFVGITWLLFFVRVVPGPPTNDGATSSSVNNLNRRAARREVAIRFA